MNGRPVSKDNFSAFAEWSHTIPNACRPFARMENSFLSPCVKYHVISALIERKAKSLVMRDVITFTWQKKTELSAWLILIKSRKPFRISFALSCECVEMSIEFRSQTFSRDSQQKGDLNREMHDIEATMTEPWAAQCHEKRAWYVFDSQARSMYAAAYNFTSRRDANLTMKLSWKSIFFWLPLSAAHKEIA